MSKQEEDIIAEDRNDIIGATKGGFFFCQEMRKDVDVAFLY